MKQIRQSWLPAVVLLVLALIPSLSSAQGSWMTSGASARVFIENKGQFRIPLGKNEAGPEVLYAFDDGKTMIYFTREGISYRFIDQHKRKRSAEELQEMEALLAAGKPAPKKKRAIDTKYDFVHMTWENASSSVEVTAEDATPDYHSYSFYSNGEMRDVTNIKAYKKLVYKNLYPNIDVEFVFHRDRGIKYALTLHPGADASLVKMKYDSKIPVALINGDLHIPTLFGDIVDHAPLTFYKSNSSSVIASRFVQNGQSVSFELGAYDHSQTVIIDPWTVTPAWGNSNKVWECERDAAGNAYFYGGDTPMRLRKYNSAGTLQWTYNSSWDSSGYWIGSFVVDQAGNSYITSGSNGEIRKVSTAGTSLWFNNPNGVFGPLFEYWHLCFNCDETQLVVGGMRAPNPFSVSNYRGAIMTINLANGAVTGFTPVGWVAGITIKEVRSICPAPAGGYCFLTLDSVGHVSPALAITYKVSTGYGFGYGIPSYGVTNQGISAIRATGNFVYTHNGSTIHKRNITNGAVVATASIPAGVTSGGFGGNSPGNSGLDIDNCGNVYVGSVNQIVKYDANLNQLATYPTASAVYDVAVTGSGEVLACGNNFASSINTAACAPMSVVCITSTLSATGSSTNLTCNSVCNGTATASPSGGTAPYTYSWAPSGGTSATATSLCAGTYTCTVTDNVGGTTTVSFTITQPSAMTSSISSQTNVNCNGGATGSATVTSGGGTGAHTYSWAPSGGTSATANNLAAGTYTCTITDANGCSRTQTVTITQPPAMTSSISSQTNVNCNGATTGSATVTSGGGTGAHTYSWAPSGGTSATASNLGAGTYTCTITDANGCSRTQTITITQAAAMTSSVSSQTNVACNGGNTGSATIASGGGTGAHTYSWAPSGGTSATANNLGAGTYTCTITDANGCSRTQTVTITQPPAMTSSVSSQTNVLCNGGSTGSATIASGGGTGTHTYSWAPSGGTSATANNLAAGNYTCTITDANGCSQTQAVSITQPSALSASLGSQTNVLCNGASTGSATINASGGTGTLTYAWTPSGGTTATANGLAAGNYTCTVTDANGCTQTQAVNITQGPAINASATSTDATCGASNGSATVNASGGTGTLTYSWAPSGGTAATANSLAAGSYTCTITDANGCTQIASTTVNNTNGPTVTPQPQTDVSCNGGANGSASVTVSGGTLPYTYAWSPTGGTGASASGLNAGSYTVTVTDNSGCISTQVFNITEPPAVSASIVSATPATCGSNNGSATAGGTGGTGSYTYSWSSGGTAATENNLAAGSYTVTVTDANGCASTATATIANTGGPALSLQSSSNTACFGGSDGAATIGATGTGPFTYSWAPSGGNAASASGLPAGSYTVTVTDANSCASTYTVTISEPSAIAPNTTSTPATCGNNNGTASAAPSGGTGPYTYSWSTTQTTSTITNLGGGSYSVTITDANGCTATSTVNVTNTGAPVVTLQSSSNVTCNSGSDGSATISASGGTAPYTYSWSPSGGTGVSAGNLPAGTYTVTVTGSDGCSQTQTVLITQPGAIAASSSSTPEDCGSGNGSASVTASGGTGTLTYSWAPSGGTNATASNLSAGSYTCTITDGNGCTQTVTALVGSSGTASADAGAAVLISQGGSTTLNGTGSGSTYTWTPPAGLSCTNCPDPVASPTVTTTYTLTVTDSLGCTAADTVTVFVDIACGELYLPNAFSPNGDHQNDVFYVRGNCIKYLQFEIYNRWGEQVFMTTDNTIGWDGTWRNKPCEAAVFTYVLRATLLDGTEVEKQGNISLVK